MSAQVLTHLQTRRYTAVPPAAIHLIRSNHFLALYGSQGRALQVATEILIRQKRPIKLKCGKRGEDTEAISYKLLTRTIQLIERLTPIYGSRGRVVAACAEVLKDPK